MKQKDKWHHHHHHHHYHYHHHHCRSDFNPLMWSICMCPIGTVKEDDSDLKHSRPPPPCESHASDLSDGISNPHTIHQFYPVLFGSCDIHKDLAKAPPHLGIGSNDFFTHFKSL
jgi:hypothetical protein